MIIGIYIYLLELVFLLFLSKYAEAQWLNNVKILFLDFWGPSILFSIVAAPIYAPANNGWVFLWTLGPITGEKLKYPNSEELDGKAPYGLSECDPTFNMLCIFLLGENEPSVNLQNGRFCGDGNPKARLEAAFLRYDVWGLLLFFIV